MTLRASEVGRGDPEGPDAWLRATWRTPHKVLRKPQFWFGASMLVPMAIWYWIFGFGPVVDALRLCVIKYNLVNPDANRFVGLSNFRQILANPMFLVSLRNTLVWAVLSFLFTLPLSMVVALCLSAVRRARNLYQGLVFLPVVISLVAVSLLFSMLFDPDVGQINAILRRLGLPTLRWLAGSATALPTAVGIGVWKSLGFYVVVLTAGLLNIPQEMYDAALVDGANEWQRFWRITLPLLGHTVTLITVLLTIGALQEFTLPYVLTGGGPGSATYLYNLLIYNEAFTDLRFGTATAAALFQFAFILGISLAQLKLIRPTWSY
jgi:ABC-type sugar transport system permease subunit